MVVPDFELICEIMLVAEGFVDARALARKFITLYSLCKELLSKQVGAWPAPAGISLVMRNMTDLQTWTRLTCELENGFYYFFYLHEMLSVQPCCWERHFFPCSASHILYFRAFAITLRKGDCFRLVFKAIRAPVKGKTKPVASCQNAPFFRAVFLWHVFTSIARSNWFNEWVVFTMICQMWVWLGFIAKLLRVLQWRTNLPLPTFRIIMTGVSALSSRFWLSLVPSSEVTENALRIRCLCVHYVTLTSLRSSRMTFLSSWDWSVISSLLWMYQESVTWTLKLLWKSLPW